MDTVAYASVTTVTFWLLELSGFPQLPMASNPEANYPGWGIIPVFMLLAPLTQGVVVVSQLTQAEVFKSPRWGFQLIVNILATTALAYVTYRILGRLSRDNSLGLAILVAGALAVVVQVAYWLVLRRHFARRDLA
jgi:hypothetical protein